MFEYLGDSIRETLLAVAQWFTAPATEFKSPGFLWLLLVIPVYLVWYYWWYERNRLIVSLSYDPHKIAKPKFNWGFLRVIPVILQIFGAILAILALARPISALETQERYAEGIDIMLVLDTSGSMETEDFPPNRLEVAKSTATKFISGRLDDRIGIVLFAEDAFSYAPLTLDYGLLKKQISTISSNIMPKEGTAMGSAISVAINRMAEDKSPSKVMILLTDGASNRGQIDPITAAQLAKENKIKIYAIGIGKKEFQRRSFLGVQTIKSDLDEETLKKIAELTNGKFYRSEDPESLNKIFEIISKLEKIEIKEESYREETDVYADLLIWSLGAFVLAFLIIATFVYNPLEG